MFYSGDSALTYRDYMIINTLKDTDATAWYNALIEAMPMTELNTKYINKALVLSGN